jgi:hypothetical protein
MVMNLKSRIVETLQIRSSGSVGDALDSETLALKRQQQEDAHKLHMRRLLTARNRELDELRKIMVQRRKSQKGNEVSRQGKGALTTGITRPPSLVDGAQLVSLINELEVKVLSEPMGLTGLPAHKPPPTVNTISGNSSPPSSGSSKAHPLDDAALMVAARRWDHAADLLIKAICAGDVPRGTDWATRSAIDLFERSGQTERAAAMRLQYAQSRGRDPGRIVPPKLNASVAGRLQICEPIAWKCPAILGSDVPVALGVLLAGGKTGVPLVIDWTAASSVDVKAMEALQLSIQNAMKSQNIFVHLGLSKLIRIMRKELQNQNFSREAWSLWLTLLNWTGFRHAHRAAASAYAKRFQNEAPVFLGVRCICQPLSMPANGVAKDLVYAARFQGDLTREHAEELDRLEIRASMPGRLVVLDFRLLTSLDFFFGADLLNWVIKRHSRGETVGISYAHPLLAHFLQMLGLQHYAKLHGPLSSGMPKQLFR